MFSGFQKFLSSTLKNVDQLKESILAGCFINDSDHNWLDSFPQGYSINFD